MSPIEDFQSRDLAWISDFVMQQMVIMLRPMMEHLQQSDATVDYAQRAVQRLSMDVSEVRGDMERTNKYLGILRQGLGVQNEGKCVLQRGLEGTARTVKRLDDQLESVLGVMRGVEDSIGQLCSDMRGAGLKQEDSAKQVAKNTLVLEDLQVQVERLGSDAHKVKDSLLSNEAKMEVWQRELREMRRMHLGIGPKLEEKSQGRPPPSSQGSSRAEGPSVWPPQKRAPFASTVDVSNAGGAGVPDKSNFAAANGLGDNSSNHSGSSQASKRISRVGSGSGRSGTVVQQDHIEFGVPPRSNSRAAVRTDLEAAEVEDAGLIGQGWAAGDDAIGRPQSPGSRVAASASRLPLLTAASKQSGITRSTAEARGPSGVGGDPTAAPRLRFTATMPGSRGSPN